MLDFLFNSVHFIKYLWTFFALMGLIVTYCNFLDTKSNWYAQKKLICDDAFIERIAIIDMRNHAVTAFTFFIFTIIGIFLFIFPVGYNPNLTNILFVFLLLIVLELVLIFNSLLNQRDTDKIRTSSRDK